MTVKETLIEEYCGACVNLRFCHRDMLEPGSESDLVGSEKYVARCKALFDAHLLRGGLYD